MQFKIASQICKGEQLIQIDSQILSALMKVINATKQSNMAQGKHLDPI
jgi:adenylyl- and sulfurtransferase ThiI